MTVTAEGMQSCLHRTGSTFLTCATEVKIIFDLFLFVEKRLMVAREILQTEKNYIKALETLNEVT